MWSRHGILSLPISHSHVLLPSSQAQTRHHVGPSPLLIAGETIISKTVKSHPVVPGQACECYDSDSDK